MLHKRLTRTLGYKNIDDQYFLRCIKYKKHDLCRLKEKKLALPSFYQNIFKRMFLYDHLNISSIPFENRRTYLNVLHTKTSI